MLSSYDEFYLFSIGQSLAKDLPPEYLADGITAFRQLIFDKIAALSPEERKSFRPLITAFKTRSSAAQFSNAVESAHRIGITGKGVSVVVAEEVTSEDSKKLAKPESLVAISTVTNSHGLHVSGIVQQLAPDASLRIGHINFNPASPLDSVEEPSEFRSAEIVNASFGPAHMDVIPSSLRQILKSGRLVVQSAGNEGISF